MTPAPPTVKLPRATSGKPLCRALAGEILARPPFWFMRQAGRYLPEYRELRGKAESFLEFCYSPALACEATLQPVRRFRTDAAIIFSDILLIVDALGRGVRFAPDRGPVLEPLRSPDDLKTSARARVGERLQPVYQALERVRRALASEIALIGFAGGPWTVACYMVEGGASCEFARVRAWGRERPVEMQALIDILSEVTAAHLVAQADAGADVLQLFDSWAGVLGEADFERWCIAPTARIVRKVRRAHPRVPVIGFPNTAGPLYAAYAERVGVDAVSIDSTVPLRWAAGKLQSRCAVQGNLDPYALLGGGASLRDQARSIISVLGHGPFVFNLGHGILPQTPPEHVSELADVIRAWGS